MQVGRDLDELILVELDPTIAIQVVPFKNRASMGNVARKHQEVLPGKTLAGRVEDIEQLVDSVDGEVGETRSNHGSVDLG